MTTRFSNPAGEAGDAAAAYVRALLELLGERDPLAVLAEMADALATAAGNHNDERLRRPEAPGKWSVAEVIAHLADTELVAGWRYRHILADEQPQIAGYDQDAWARRFRYGEADIGGSLMLFRALRAANLELLRRATPADLERVGIHSERGPESLGLLVKLVAGHDLVHRRQIDRILAATA
jgi:hypothetical protein